MDSAENLRAEASGRAAVYDLVARIFAEELDATSLEWLGSGARDVLGALGDLGIDSEALARIHAAGDDTSEGALIDLAAEYASLFEAHEKVYPFASCWVPDQKPRLLGPRAAAAQKAYAEVGFGLPGNDALRLDHVGVELAFAGVLAKRVADAAEEELAEEQQRFERFVSTIMLPWMPGFFEAVIKDQRADFYAAGAKVASEFLAADVAVLGLSADERSAASS